MTGLSEYNEDQRKHGQPVVGYAEYLATGHFVEAAFENWQSEFLSVLAMVLLSIVLRQGSSPESKPVHAPHAETGR